MAARCVILSLGFIIGSGLMPLSVESQEQIGDWYFDESADPFDDTRLTYVALVNDSNDMRKINAAGIRCDKDGVWLAITHSYMAGRDNRISVQYRLGDDPAQTGSGILTNNTASFVSLDPAEVLALLESPRVAVRITDPLDNESFQSAWADLEGTEEALGMLHCL